MRRIVSCLHCLIFLFSCFPPLLANLVYPETTGRRCRRKAPSVYPGEKWRSTGCAARAACPLPPDCLVLLYVCMQFSVVMCFFSSFPCTYLHRHSTRQPAGDEESGKPPLRLRQNLRRGRGDLRRRFLPQVGQAKLTRVHGCVCVSENTTAAAVCPPLHLE